MLLAIPAFSRNSLQTHFPYHPVLFCVLRRMLFEQFPTLAAFPGSGLANFRSDIRR